MCAGRERKRDSRRGSERMHMRQRSVSVMLLVTVCYPVEVFINTMAACVMQQNDRRRLFFASFNWPRWAMNPNNFSFLKGL